MVGSATRCRVFITGAGVVTPIGASVPEYWSSLAQGKCGIGPIEGIALEPGDIQIAGQIKDFDERARLRGWKRDKTILHSDRYSWLAAAAADEAIAQAQLETPFAQPYRVACIIGSAAGGQTSGEKGCRDRFADNKPAVHPMFLPRMIGSSASAHVGIEYGVKGPTFGTCSAGASAAHAIALGADYIRHGMFDIVIVGGSDSSVTLGTILAGQSLQLLSPEGCFPFSRNRSGTVLAEAAGVLVLESDHHARARGARRLGEVRGFAMTAGSAHVSKPSAEAMSEAMLRAMQDAGLTTSDIGWINAHGTATKLNDPCETKAIRRAFGKHADALAVSATKSIHGNALGASPAIEAVACIEAMRAGWIPPTIGLSEPDPECDLDYVANVGRAMTPKFVMSSSFGLGGLYAVLVLGPPSD